MRPRKGAWRTTWISPEGSAGHPQGVPIRSEGPGCLYHDTCQSLLPLRGHRCPGTLSPPGHRQGELQQPEGDPGAGSWKRKHFGVLMHKNSTGL